MPIGIIAVADRPREAARDAVDILKQQGIRSVVMLTGDSTATAAAIAADLGIDEVRAELMPEDKVKVVEDLRRRYGAVAMVGDGINDAPALASADVGIVMGAAGSDAAIESADIALMADELLKIPYALRLSRATMRNIKANLVISLALKAAFVLGRDRRCGHSVDGRPRRHRRLDHRHRERAAAAAGRLRLAGSSRSPRTINRRTQNTQNQRVSAHLEPAPRFL